MIKPNTIPANKVAFEIYKEFQPIFYINIVKNHPAYSNEPSLLEKVNIWFKYIMGIESIDATIRSRTFPTYHINDVNKIYHQYKEIFQKFLNTKIVDINYQYFKNYINSSEPIQLTSLNNNEDYDEYDEEDIDNLYEDAMEAASEELLKQQEVYYV